MDVNSVSEREPLRAVTRPTVRSLKVSRCCGKGYNSLAAIWGSQGKTLVINRGDDIGLVACDTPTPAAHPINVEKLLAGGILVRERVADEGVGPMVDLGHS